MIVLVGAAECFLLMYAVFLSILMSFGEESTELNEKTVISTVRIRRTRKERGSFAHVAGVVLNSLKG